MKDLRKVLPSFPFDNVVDMGRVRAELLSNAYLSISGFNAPSYLDNLFVSKSPRSRPVAKSVHSIPPPVLPAQIFHFIVCWIAIVVRDKWQVFRVLDKSQGNKPVDLMQFTPALTQVEKNVQMSNAMPARLQQANARDLSFVRNKISGIARYFAPALLHSPSYHYYYA